MALACDIRIASDSAKFGQPEILLGMIPGSGATQRLPRLIGQGMARELIFTGEIIDANEALRIGLVNRVVPASELRKVTMEMAEKIAARGALSLKMAKRRLRMKKLLFIALIGFGVYHAHNNGYFLSKDGAFEEDGKPIVRVFVGPNCGDPCDDVKRMMAVRHVDYELIDVSSPDGQEYGIQQYPLTMVGLALALQHCPRAS